MLFAGQRVVPGDQCTDREAGRRAEGVEHAQAEDFALRIGRPFRRVVAHPGQQGEGQRRADGLAHLDHERPHRKVPCGAVFAALQGVDVGDVRQHRGRHHAEGSAQEAGAGGDRQHQVEVAGAEQHVHAMKAGESEQAEAPGVVLVDPAGDAQPEGHAAQVECEEDQQHEHDVLLLVQRIQDEQRYRDRRDGGAQLVDEQGQHQPFERAIAPHHLQAGQQGQARRQVVGALGDAEQGAAHR